MASLGLVPGAIPSGGGPLAYVDDLDAPHLSTDDHHHLARVRRTRDGDPLVLGDGQGRWRTATMAGATPLPSGEVHRQARLEPMVAVGFALVKGAKPELVVQKLTELGVDRIVAFVAARSVVRWDDAKAASAHERLQKVAREAAMQSRQAWLPVVDPVTTFSALVAGAGPGGVVLAERGGAPPSMAAPFVLVGPEGGWSDEERAAADHVALSTGVLRAETAAIVAGSLLVGLRAGVVAPA